MLLTDSHAAEKAEMSIILKCEITTNYYTGTKMSNVSCLTYLNLLYFIILMIFDHEIPHYVILSSLLLLSIPWVQIFSSVLYFQTTLIHVLPLG
jgi:hypothetical protein